MIISRDLKRDEKDIGNDAYIYIYNISFRFPAIAIASQVQKTKRPFDDSNLDRDLSD